MPTLNIRLFGQFSVCCGDAALEDLIPGKAKELFCYLLIHGARPLAREALATVLWEDCTSEHSRQYLRKALWQLQRALCQSGSSAGPVLEVDAQWVSLPSCTNIRVDVIEFEQSFSRAQHPASLQDGSRRYALQAAVDLYGGGLLEGWYQDWCLYDRERLQNMYLVMLDKLVACCEADSEYEMGVSCAGRILDCDRAHESAHQHIMRLRYLSGDRAGALRQFEHCAAALKEELGVEPSQRTRDLCRQIREGRPLAISTGPSTGPSGLQKETGEEASLLEAAMKRLTEVKASLASLQHIVDETLAGVGQALRSSSRNNGQPK